MSTVAQLVHADTFADFIEMATNLLDEGGYRDAAAVIAGSSLEAHLRNLATNAGVPVAKRDGYPLKPSVINAALAKAKVYEKLTESDNCVAEAPESCRARRVREVRERRRSWA